MRRIQLIGVMTIMLSIVLNGCATIIGGNQPTYKTTGSGVGPATISSGDQNLHNNRFSALTINGDLTANKILVVNDLNIESDANLTLVTVRDDSNIKGNLLANNCTFKDSMLVEGNINSTDSYFGDGIDFTGTVLQLTNRSKVIGNIISRANAPVTITINKSRVKGNIQFAYPGGVVILQNKGTLKGQVFNGTIVNK